jgi:hypothetical protein
MMMMIKGVAYDLINLNTPSANTKRVGNSFDRINVEAIMMNETFRKKERIIYGSYQHL